MSEELAYYSSRGTSNVFCLSFSVYGFLLPKETYGFLLPIFSIDRHSTALNNDKNSLAVTTVLDPVILVIAKLVFVDCMSALIKI